LSHPNDEKHLRMWQRGVNVMARSGNRWPNSWTDTLTL